MAETYTASILFSMYKNIELNPDNKVILKNFGLMGDKGGILKSVLLEKWAKETPNAPIQLDSEGKLTRIISCDKMGGETSSGVDAKKNNRATEYMSKEDLERLLSTPNFCVKADDVKKVLEDFVKTLPREAETYKRGETSSGGYAKKNKRATEHISKEDLDLLLLIPNLSVKADDVKKIPGDFVKTIPQEAETYKSGEIEVHYFPEVRLSISNLLAAGTKVLDALLFMKYKDAEAHKELFDVHAENFKEVNRKELASNIANAQNAIKAAFILIYNRGSLPIPGEKNKQLSKFVTGTLFGGSIECGGQLAELLSCTNPQKFPCKFFLDFPVNSLPTAVASRCKMLICGNKAVRYAAVSKGFSRRAKKAFTASMTPDEVESIESENNLLKIATGISDYLASLLGRFEVQKRMHPLSGNRPTINNFTLKLTHAIIYCLTIEGRFSLKSKIDSSGITSFRNDESFYGVTDAEGNHYWPVLENPDASFIELSEETVKGIYEGNM